MPRLQLGISQQDLGLFPFFPFLLPGCVWLPEPQAGRDRVVTILSLQEAIMEQLDHKNLDKDVPYFSEVVRWVRGLLEGLEHLQGLILPGKQQPLPVCAHSCAQPCCPSSHQPGQAGPAHPTHIRWQCPPTIPLN